MKATVVGSWHLAAVYAAGLAELGHEVRLICGEAVRDQYLAGKPPIFEPGVAEALERAKAEGRFSVVSDVRDRENAAPVCFFAEDVKVVPEGVDPASFRPLFDAVASSGYFATICVSSQLPVGTAHELQTAYPRMKLVYFPEFLRLGEALSRFLKPDYVVFGGDGEATRAVLEYFKNIAAPKFEVTLEEAEMTKHAANIYMALSVSFIEELTKFSERYDIDLQKVGEILRCDQRIGSKAYVLPGMGFSGETVERDLRVLLSRSRELGIKIPLLEQIIPINDEHNRFIERELAKRVPGLERATVGFLGATYRPETSTLRGSLFTALMEKLAARGTKVRLWDPHVAEYRFLVPDAGAVFSEADAVVITVSKKEFRELDYPALFERMHHKIIIDAANLLPKDAARRWGISYAAIGRGRV